MASKKQSAATTAAEVGAGVLAAAAAAGAGYYFYGAKDAKKHRASASKWAKGMKADVVREAKKLKKIDQQQMAKIVDRAAAAYSTARSVDTRDLKAAAAELKKNWRAIGTEASNVKGRAKRAVKSARKSAKKAAKAVKRPAAKKSAKKSAKKAVRKSRKTAKKRSR